MTLKVNLTTKTIKCLNKWVKQLTKDLKTKKVDCVVMDELPANEILNSNSGLKILPGFLTNDSYGMIVKKGNTELLNTINTVLNRLVQDGTIDSYIIKHTGK